MRAHTGRNAVRRSIGRPPGFSDIFAVRSRSWYCGCVRWPVVCCFVCRCGAAQSHLQPPSSCDRVLSRPIGGRHTLRVCGRREIRNVRHFRLHLMAHVDISGACLDHCGSRDAREPRPIAVGGRNADDARSMLDGAQRSSVLRSDSCIETSCCFAHELLRLRPHMPAAAGKRGEARKGGTHRLGRLAPQRCGPRRSYG